MSVAPLAAETIRKVMLEIVAVAVAAGYGHVISADTVESQFARSISRPFPGVQPSMMADALDEVPLEIDAIVGRIVKLGREKGIETPRLEILLVLLQGLNCSFTMRTQAEKTGGDESSQTGMK